MGLIEVLLQLQQNQDMDNYTELHIYTLHPTRYQEISLGATIVHYCDVL